MFHSVNHRGREKLADICFKLNVEDGHTVNYALKSLLNMSWCNQKNREREVFMAPKAGQALCMAYRDVRESCLVDEYAAC